MWRSVEQPGLRTYPTSEDQPAPPDEADEGSECSVPAPCRGHSTVRDFPPTPPGAAEPVARSDTGPGSCRVTSGCAARRRDDFGHRYSMVSGWGGVAVRL